MKTQTPGWLVGLAAVACSFSSCTEPATECQVGLAGFSSFATVYTSKGPPSPAGCEMANPKVVQLGDLIGMEYYHPVSADGTTYDDNSATVAIKTDSIGEEYGQYNAGCPAPACAAAQPCTYVPAGDAGTGSNGDSDCDPTGAHTGQCATVNMDGSLTPGCTASSASCACLTATCVSSADCQGGAPCNNGTCGVSCGPAAGCAGPCTTDADCGGGTCAMGQCVTSCGSCPSGQTCGGGGTPGFCGVGSTCTPATCATAGSNCGPTPDGCGGLLQCGTCTMPQTCGGNGTPNVCGAPVADPTASDTLYAKGSFAQHYPDANNLCQVVNLTPAVQTFATLPPGAAPTDTLKYAWSNVNVLVTAADQGTQMSADLTYTENGCSASYHVLGIWPAVDCTATVPDPNDPRGLNIIGQIADPDACNPCEEPAKGRFVGSGISPDYPTACKQIFPTTCDAQGNCLTSDPFGRDPFYCVLAGTNDPPQVLPSPITCSN